MISPYKIRWNGITSNSIPFDIITQCSFDGDSGDSETFLSRDAVVSETYNGAMKRGSSYKWNESFAPTITILKKDFSDFTREENRYILSWLTSKQSPGFIDVYMDDSEVIEYSVLGNWTSVSQYKIGNSRVAGYICQFTALTPYAFSRLYTETKDMAENTLTINIDTDEPESAIYPRITIQHGPSVIVNVNHAMISNRQWIDDEDWIDGVVYYYADAADGPTWYYQRHYVETDDDGNVIAKSEPTATQTNPVNEYTKTGVIIKNTYVDGGGATRVSTLRIANNTRDEKVILDGANRVVSSWYLGTDATTGQQNVWIQDTSRVFGDYFNWNWLPLYNGTNEIEVIGNCTVTFEYREIRKPGNL